MFMPKPRIQRRKALRPYFGKELARAIFVEPVKRAGGLMQLPSYIAKANAAIEPRANYTKRPSEGSVGAVKRLVRLARGRMTVGNDIGYTEMHAEAAWARQQLANLLNFHLEQSNHPMQLEASAFNISGGNTGALQLVTSAIGLARPFKKRGIKTILMPKPNYWGFGPQLGAGAAFRSLMIPTNTERGFSDYIAKMKQTRPDIVYIMKPDNPSGFYVKDKHIVRLARELPKDSILFVDMTIASSSKYDTRTPLQRVSDLMAQIGDEPKVAYFISASKEYQRVRERFGLTVTANEKLGRFLNKPTEFMGHDMKSKFPGGLIFDDKSVPQELERTVKEMTRNELGISRLGVPIRYPLTKAALREGYRILEQRAKEMGLGTIKDAAGSFTILTLPKGIKGKDVLQWTLDNKVWGKEDSPFTLTDIADNQLRIFMTYPKTLDRWLDVLETYLGGIGRLPIKTKIRANLTGPRKG